MTTNATTPNPKPKKMSDQTKDMISRCGSLVERIGVPTAFLAAITYLFGWVLAPPVIDSHVKFLERVTATQESMSHTLEAMVDTQESMTITLDSMADTLDQIHEVEERTGVFMDAVAEEHARAEKKLDVLIERE